MVYVGVCMETIRYQFVDPKKLSLEELEELRRLESASHADTLKIGDQALSAAQVGALVSEDDIKEYHDNLVDRNNAVGRRVNANQEYRKQSLLTASDDSGNLVGFAQTAVNISGPLYERIYKRFRNNNVYVTLIRCYVLPKVLEYDSETNEQSTENDNPNLDNEDTIELLKAKKGLLIRKIKLKLIKGSLSRYNGTRYHDNPVTTYLWSIDDQDEIKLFELLGFKMVEETTKYLFHDGTGVKEFRYRADSLVSVIEAVDKMLIDVDDELSKYR